MSKLRGSIAKDMADHVMEQLSGLDGVRRIPMMGGYIFYIHDRVFGGIYESCDLMIKITETSRKYMPDSVPEPPLEGARDMLPCTILEDRELLQEMVERMHDDLPEPKLRKPRTGLCSTYFLR